MEAPEEIKGSKGKPVKSDGGSSSYYDLTLPTWLVSYIKDRVDESGRSYVKTEELIEVVFSNDFDFANILKSLVRAKGITEGGGKVGNTLSYEMNKIKYSADKVVTVNSR